MTIEFRHITFYFYINGGGWMSKVDLDKEEKALVIEQFVTKFDHVLGQIDLITDFVVKTDKERMELKESLGYLVKLNRKIKNAEKFSEVDKFLYLNKLYKRFDKNGRENLFDR